MEISIKPVATVKNGRDEITDDFWGDITSIIELEDDIPTESLDGINEFSHIEVLFYFHQSGSEIKFSRHPRGNTLLQITGIFAQRAKDRPNRLGITVAKLIRREGRKLFVQHLDAINGTPILDIKPVMKEFLISPQEVRQPEWATEMMQDYWKTKEGKA